MQTLSRAVLVSVLAVHAPVVHALDLIPDSVTLGLGQSILKKAHITSERVGLRWRWDRDFANSLDWVLNGYFELGYSQWQSQLSSNKTRSINGADKAWQASFAPVFRLTPAYTNWRVQPFFDFGIGLSYQSETDLEQQRLSAINMGGHTQFEIRTAVGVQFGDANQYEISYGWFHYSNASLHDENEGLDLQMLSFALNW